MLLGRGESFNEVVVHSAVASHSWAVALFALPTGAWFAYFRLKERAGTRQPFGLLLVALVAGHLSALVSLSIYNCLEAWGCPADWRLMQVSWGDGALVSLVIGSVEEGTKVLPVLLIGLFSRSFTRPAHGIFVAAAVGMGFACAENAIFTQQGLTVMEGIARAAATPITHALFAAPFGFGLGRMLLRGHPLDFLLGLTVSVMSHGFYDLLLARPHVPKLAAALVVLGLWVWLLVRTAPKVIATVRASGLTRRLAT